ncbi:hypothetical protein G6F24_016034 [Rhizopus arrhizus]|nr:hypothetical protein G6F24_016034 [Rhizopus arrhizus]
MAGGLVAKWPPSAYSCAPMIPCRASERSLRRAPVAGSSSRRPLVLAGSSRRLAARVLVPAGGLPADRADPGRDLAGPDPGRTRADDRLDAAGAGDGVGQRGHRGGDRTLRQRNPRTGRPRQGHGLGGGVRADDERTAVLGAGRGSARAGRQLRLKPHSPTALKSFHVL